MWPLDRNAWNTNRDAPVRRMKVLYVVNSLTQDSVGGHDGFMQEAFRHLGWDVIEFAPGAVRGGGSDSSALARRVYRSLSKVLPATASSKIRLRYTLWYDDSSADAIVKIIRREKPDLVFERYASLQKGCARAAAANSIPYVVCFHAPATESPHYGASSRIARLLETRIVETATRASLVVTVSEYMKTYLSDLGVRPERVLVLPNGVDSRLFTKGENRSSLREQFGLSPSRVVIGFVGTVKRWHGCDILPAVFSSVKESVPAAAFILVGPFSTSRGRSVLAAQLMKYGIDRDFILTDRVPPEKIPEYIRAMDICIMPDSNDYGSPMKLFEYGACGKAVVMPRRGPVEQVIREGENGLLFDPGSALDLAEKVIFLATNPQVRLTLGSRLQADVHSNYTYEKNVRRILLRAGFAPSVDRSEL